MENFVDLLLQKLDWYVVFIVIFSGYFQKRFLSPLVVFKNESLNSAYKTLLVSFIVSAIYVFAAKNPEQPTNWANVIFSYFAATSMYELIVDPIVSYIVSKIPKAGP